MAKTVPSCTGFAVPARHPQRLEVRQHPDILIGACNDTKIIDFGLSCIPNSAEIKERPWGQSAVDTVFRTRVRKGDLPQSLESMGDFEKKGIVKVMCAFDPFTRVSTSLAVEKLHEHAQQETTETAAMTSESPEKDCAVEQSCLHSTASALNAPTNLRTSMKDCCHIAKCFAQ